MIRRYLPAALFAGMLALASTPALAQRAPTPVAGAHPSRLGNDDKTKSKGDKPKDDKAKSKDEKPAPFSVEVLVLHATNSGQGIDPKIGDMPELKKPPFSAYDSYKLLDTARLPLDKEHPQRMRLPNGRVLETRLLESLQNDTLRISASINQPKGKEFLPLLEVKAKVGQAFIVAGQSYRKGILVLVIRVVR